MDKEQKILEWMSKFRCFDKEDNKTYRKFMADKEDIEKKAISGDIDSLNFLKSVGFSEKVIPNRFNEPRTVFVYEKGISLWSLYKQAEL